MNYKKIFWGFIFLFDFRIEGFDILPDIIGFILITIGLASLVQINDKYKAARFFAIPLIFLSIFDIFQPIAEVNQTGLTSTGVLGILLSMMVTILAVLMVRGIIMGLREEAELKGLDELAKRAGTSWNLYLTVSVLLTISIIVPFLAGVLFIPLFILSVVSYILILNLLKKAESDIWSYAYGPGIL